MSTEGTAPADSPLPVRTHVLLLSSAFFFIFLGAGAQQYFLLRYLSEFTGWSKVQCPFVIAAVYLSMMVFRLGNVRLLGRWPEWLLVRVGALTYAVFTAVMVVVYFVPSYPLALAAALFWGWGGAAMWLGSTMQILALADRARRHGTGMGILYAATQAGWLAGVIVLGNIAEAVQDTHPYLLYVAATVFTLVGNIVVVYLPRQRVAVPEMPTWRGLVALMGRAKPRIAAFLLFAGGLTFGFILGVFGDFVKAEHGTAWLWITGSFYPLALFVLSFTSGVLSERVSHGSVLAMGFFGGAAGLLVPVFVAHPAGLAATALLLGFLNGSVPVVSSALIGASADRARRPLAHGAFFTWRDLGVVVAVVVGSLLGVSTDNFVLVFEVFAGVFFACGLVSLVLNKYAQERL